MKLAKVLLLISACVLLANCEKGENTNTSNAIANTANTNVTINAKPTPQATLSASASPTATAPPQDKVSTPEDAAQGLFNAFGRHDRAAAAKFATEAAIAKLFKESTGTQGMEFQGCNEEDGDLNCAYSYEGGALIMHMKGSASAGYKVDAIEIIAD